MDKVLFKINIVIVYYYITNLDIQLTINILHIICMYTLIPD